MITIKEEFVGGEKWKRAVKLGKADAILMWLALKRYAAEHTETEGFIPDEDIDELPGAPRAARKALDALVTCGALRRDGSRAQGLLLQVDGGWQLLDEGDGHSVRRARFLDTQRRPSGVACSYCGCELMLGYTNGKDGFTIDHVIPRCQGGGDDPSNRVPACRSCNSRKCGRTPEQARMVLQ